MKIEDTRLNKINLALMNSARDYDKGNIEKEVYLILHKKLTDNRTRIIEKILRGQNE